MARWVLFLCCESGFFEMVLLKESSSFDCLEVTLLCPCAPIRVEASGLFLLDSFMPFEVSICFIVAVHSPHPSTPSVCLSEWVRFTAPLIPFLVPSKRNEKIQALQRGLFVSLRIVFGLFWDSGHWKKMTPFSERLATFSFSTLNSSRERIPVRCRFTAKHSSATFCSSHSHPYVPPGCYPISLHTPAPPLPIKRKSEGARAQWGQMKVYSL